MEARLPSTRVSKPRIATIVTSYMFANFLRVHDFLSFTVGQGSLYKHAQKVNPGSYEHETCTRKQLIPYSYRVYQHLKDEIWTKVASFLKSACKYLYLANHRRHSIDIICRACINDDKLTIMGKETEVNRAVRVSWMIVECFLGYV